MVFLCLKPNPKKQIESHKFRRGSIASPVVIPEGFKLQIKNQINEF